jgi:hypothetical protein
VVLGEAEVDDASGVGRRVVEVAGASADPGVVERVVVPGAHGGGAGGQGRARGEQAPREGAVDRGSGGGGPGLRGGPVALDVELEEVEERAGDEGAEHEAAPALHHPLQRHDDAHPAVRARRAGGGGGPPLGGGVVPHGRAARGVGLARVTDPGGRGRDATAAVKKIPLIWVGVALETTSGGLNSRSPLQLSRTRTGAFVRWPFRSFQGRLASALHPFLPHSVTSSWVDDKTNDRLSSDPRT